MRAVILLAAGASRRFGRRDKLMERLGRHSLLEHSIANARAAGLGRIILVSRARQRYPGVTHVRAIDAHKGLSASLAAGLAALRPIEREILVFLGDMPFARAPRLMLPTGADAVRPRFRGTPGHPILVRASTAQRLLGQGDKGLADAVAPRWVSGTAGNILDIDTRAALLRARLHGSRARSRRSMNELKQGDRK